MILNNLKRAQSRATQLAMSHVSRVPLRTKL